MTAQSVAAKEHYPSPFMQWLTVGVLFILYIRSLADRYLIALLVEPIKADTGMSDFQISLLQGGAFAVLYCVCAIPVGLALDRFSRRWVLFACVALWSLGAAGCGLVGSFATLAVMRSLVGAGEAAWPAAPCGGSGSRTRTPRGERERLLRRRNGVSNAPGRRKRR